MGRPARGALHRVWFDLATMLLLWLLGRRIRGPTLGIALAYGWAAFPFTLFTLESNANDSLVAMLVVLTLLVVRRPAARGAAGALAGLSKFAPLGLAPLLATYDAARERVTLRPRVLLPFLAAFAVDGGDRAAAGDPGEGRPAHVL